MDMHILQTDSQKLGLTPEADANEFRVHVKALYCTHLLKSTQSVISPCLYVFLLSAATGESAIRNSVGHHSAFAATSAGPSPWKPQPGRSGMVLTVAAAYGETEKSGVKAGER